MRDSNSIFCLILFFQSYTIPRHHAPTYGAYNLPLLSTFLIFLNDTLPNHNFFSNFFIFYSRNFIQIFDEKPVCAFNQSFRVIEKDTSFLHIPSIPCHYSSLHPFTFSHLLIFSPLFFTLSSFHCGLKTLRG